MIPNYNVDYLNTNTYNTNTYIVRSNAYSSASTLENPQNLSHLSVIVPTRDSLTNQTAEAPDMAMVNGTNDLISLQAAPESSKRELTFAQAHETLNKTRNRYQKLREKRIKRDSEEIYKMLED